MENGPAPDLRAGVPHSVRSYVHALGLLAVLAAGLYAHWPTLDYAMLGADSYLQIATSRVESAAELPGTFARRLSDGRIIADFYRPVESLSLALDYHNWQLDPRGYHITSLILLGLCILCGYAATRRLLGRRAWLGPLIAALLIALHASLLHAVAMPANRSEPLVLLFLMLALLSLHHRPRSGWFAPLAAGVFVTLASGSKEAGMVGLLLVLLHWSLCLRGESFYQYVGRVLLASLPAAVGVGAYVVNRTIVIGGPIGGFRAGTWETYADNLKVGLSKIFTDALSPVSFLPGLTATQLAFASAYALGVLAVALMFAGAVATRGRRSSASADTPMHGEIAEDAGGSTVASEPSQRLGGTPADDWPRIARTLVLGIAWIAALLPSIGAGPGYQPWHVVIPLGGLALVLAAIVHACELLLRAGGWRRVIGVPMSAVMLIVLAGALWTSPLYTRYPELREASERMKAQFDALDALVSDMKLGRRYVIEMLEEYRPTTPQGRPPLGSVTLASLRMVRSYCQARYPDLPLRVEYDFRSEGQRAHRSEILLQIRRLDPSAPQSDQADERA